MANNARKHQIPAGGDTSVSRATIFETFGNSIRDVVPVANVTERALLVSALASAGFAPSPSNPLVVYRADARGLHRLEYTADGAVWVSASGLLEFASKAEADSWGVSNASMLTVGDRASVGGVPYVWNGTGWARSNDRAITAQIRKGGTQASLTSSFANVLTLTVTDAPAGRWRLDAVAVTYSNAVATHFKSARVGGEASNVATGTPLNGAGDWIQNWPSNVHCKQTDFWFFDHVGGDLKVHLDAAIDAGSTRAAADGCRLALLYVGPV